MKKIISIFLLYQFIFILRANEVYSQVLIEAENFNNYGGWVLDQEFMDQMGSPYLMAHGMGKPVENAKTEVIIPIAGKYKVFVRTYNWTSPWYKDEGPGKFKLKIYGNELPVELGTKGNCWMWQEAGVVDLSRSQVKRKGFHGQGKGDYHRFTGIVVDIELEDLTGFNGRCDAILLTQDMDYIPPTDINELRILRKRLLGLPESPKMAGNYDLVVVGAGVAGCTAAMTAARLGLKVALINDRPVLGGANTSEVRVGISGGISHNYYPKVGNILREISKFKDYDANDKKRSTSRTHPPRLDKSNFKEIEDFRMELFKNTPNITLFLNTRVYDVIMNDEVNKGKWIVAPHFTYDPKVDNNSISAVLGRNTVTGEEYCISSDLFVDCTGDGCVGYLAGADYRMGRESYYETFEKSAPYISDNMKMGITIQWGSLEQDSISEFPVLPWAVQCNDNYYFDSFGSTWNWETGFELDPFKDGERMRDNALRSIYGNWSYLKNNKPEKYGRRTLANVGYLSGKRESRRLLGDVILTETDILNGVDYPDKSYTATWSMDLHYPDEENSKFFPGNEWLSWCSQPEFEPYHAPYRTLYSRNIKNLFMAGRCVSVTHVALGTVRVQATTGQMGEVVGMAAKICHDKNALPRDVYEKYLSELISMMKNGL